MTLNWYGIVSPEGKLIATEEDKATADRLAALLGKGYKAVPVIIGWDLAE